MIRNRIREFRARYDMKQEELARLLAVLEPRCREEWRAGFPNVEERLAAEKAREQGGSPV